MKVRNGNPGRRPFNPDEPLPNVKIPDCPAELNELAREEWRRIVNELTNLNMLTGLDRAALGAYCQAYALWAEAVTQVEQYGLVVKSPKGFPIQSPWLGILNRQAEIMLRLASEFGFTPASRSRIAAPREKALPLFDHADVTDVEDEEPAEDPDRADE